ncbi:putative membrane protein [Melghiribacillus thermohalophilus]|uniref:Putative membrane protein n=1 Tax=Melghiribacillus thermohalophilus TaxID=1324956 RepID=A0A4R3N6S8_9BACI|nr:DUF350 domain-containing protein [Melghiribacillus thermohalophilus]TCT24970.1 putative membrane protein [Melghiribacillus thermohalophilus]
MEPFVSTFLYFILSIIVIGAGLLIFEMVTTKYKDWEEIGDGNQAVALSIAGKVIGIGIILSFAIYHSANLLEVIIWGGYGVVLQIIAYFVFELLTRKFSVEEKLREGNVAVGMVALAVSIALAFVVGASIT